MKISMDLLSEADRKATQEIMNAVRTGRLPSLKKTPVVLTQTKKEN